jgi:DedD protein
LCTVNQGIQVAKTVSEEEIQLRKRARRRLVGSITLVIAAVVILPMVLDSKPEQRIEEIDIRIPAEDAVAELGPESEMASEVPLRTAQEAPKSEIQAANQPASQSLAKSAPTVKGVEKPDAPKGTGDSGSKVAVGSGRGVAAPASSEVFVVQLGAFTDLAKANQKLQSLLAKDIGTVVSAEAYTETIKADKGLDKNAEKGVGKGDITRVRVGPFRTREEAENAREKLKTLGFNGVVADK